MQDGRQGLIDQQAQHGVQQALDQREGHIKDHKALDQAVGRGQDSLIHPQNGFQRHMVELHIGRVGDEVVGGHAEHRHSGCTGDSAQNGGLAALVALVDKARHSGEYRAQHKVAQLAHAGSGGALDDDVQQVLHKADDHAVHRAQCKGTQQGGQVGEVHLDKGRDEHRQRKLDEHQDKGDRAEHGGNGQVVGGILFHGSCPPRGIRPIQICSESPFRAGSNRKDKPKSALLQPKNCNRAHRRNLPAVSCIRTIPLVPELHRVSTLASGRGLYRQWGIAPRPETNFLIKSIARPGGAVKPLFFEDQFSPFFPCPGRQSMLS